MSQHPEQPRKGAWRDMASAPCLLLSGYWRFDPRSFPAKLNAFSERNLEKASSELGCSEQSQYEDNC
jgi:hypothetical protein